MENLLDSAEQLVDKGGYQEAIYEMFREQSELMQRFLRNSTDRSFSGTIGKPLALAGFFGSNPFITPFFPVLDRSARSVRKGWGLELELGMGGRMEEATGYQRSQEITSLLLTDFNSGGKKQLLIPYQRVIHVPETTAHASPNGDITVQELFTFPGLFSLLHEQGHSLNGMTAGVMEANAKERILTTLQDTNLLPSYQDVTWYLQGIRDHYLEMYQIDLRYAFETPFTPEDSATIMEDEANANLSALTRVRDVLDSCRFDKKHSRDQGLRDGVYARLEMLALQDMAIKIEQKNGLLEPGMSPYDIVDYRFGSSVVNYLRSIF